MTRACKLRARLDCCDHRGDDNLRHRGDNAVLARSASMQNRIAMYNGNALKIGLFGANCSSGRSATKVPERWSATWPDCLALARLADAAGLDFMLPIARWKGYGGDTDFHGRSLETITWAVGLL
jgi:FMNH2-dependent dimethyl sulfone monooxygenase